MFTTEEMKAYQVHVSDYPSCIRYVRVWFYDDGCIAEQGVHQLKSVKGTDRSKMFDGDFIGSACIGYCVFKIHNAKASLVLCAEVKGRLVK